ncbi:MAG: hypothetical protein ACRC68_07345 [Clostridium sp.]
MGIDKLMGIETVISIILLLGIVLAIFRGIKKFRDYITNTKEMNKKVDDILDNFKNKE